MSQAEHLQNMGVIGRSTIAYATYATRWSKRDGGAKATEAMTLTEVQPPVDRLQ